MILATLLRRSAILWNYQQLCEMTTDGNEMGEVYFEHEQTFTNMFMMHKTIDYFNFLFCFLLDEGLKHILRLEHKHHF